MRIRGTRKQSRGIAPLGISNEDYQPGGFSGLHRSIPRKRVLLMGSWVWSLPGPRFTGSRSSRGVWSRCRKQMRRHVGNKKLVRERSEPVVGRGLLGPRPLLPCLKNHGRAAATSAATLWTLNGDAKPERAWKSRSCGTTYPDSVVPYI